MAAESSAQFSIELDGNVADKSKADVKALEDLRSSVKGSQDAIRQYSETLRTLTGKSTDVVDAKAKLKAAIDREKTAMSAASVEITKAGSSYGKLAAAAKKAAAANEGSAKAIKSVGGPLQVGIDKLEAFKEAMGGGSKVAALFAGGLALVAVAVAAVTVGFIAGAVGIAKWILEAADAARSMQLVREAATGSAETAKNLGTQVDLLARKVPTAKKELNDLGADLYRRFNNTSASGQVIVDTFNIITQSSEAMGKTVGNQLGDIIERSKRFGLVRINPFELQGTGIKFEDVSRNLAKQTGATIEQARRALFEGRVKLDAAAAALRKTVDDRFSEVNARKLLSLDVIFNKWREALGSLTRDVKLEPLARALGDFLALFDPTKTKTGENLRKLTELVGNGLIKAFVKLEPIAKAVFKGLVIGALDVGIATLKLAVWWKNSFGGLKTDKLDLAKIALTGAKVAVYALASGLAIAAALAYTFYKPIELLIGGIAKLQALTSKPVIGEGFTSSGKNLLGGGATSLAGGGQEASSAPAALVAPAHAKGGTVMTPAPGEVFASVAPGEQIIPAGGFAAGGGGSAKGPTSIALTVHFHVGAGMAAKSVARELAQPSILAPLTRAIEDVLVAAGFPVQTPAMP